MPVLPEAFFHPLNPEFVSRAAHSVATSRAQVSLSHTLALSHTLSLTHTHTPSHALVPRAATGIARSITTSHAQVSTFT